MGSSVAYSAHAGGFAFGAVTALVAPRGARPPLAAEQGARAAGVRAEDEVFEQAQELARQGRIGEAIALRGGPRPQAGAPRYRELALELADRTRSAGAYARHAAHVLLVVRTHLRKVVAIYRRLAAASEDRPIDEKTLTQVLTASFAIKEREMVEDVLRRSIEATRRAARSRGRCGSWRSCTWRRRPRPRSGCREAGAGAPLRSVGGQGAARAAG